MRRRLDLAAALVARAAGAVPRRADDRPGPAQPHRAVGDDRGARRRGHDRAAHDPVPRRGRPAGRPHRGHRPRPRDRRGHGGRAEGARRRRARRGDARAPEAAARGDAALGGWPTSRRRSTATSCASRSASATARSWTRRAGSTARASASSDIAVRRPTLDDVFLTLTGHAAEDAEPGTRGPSRADGGGGMSASSPTRW